MADKDNGTDATTDPSRVSTIEHIRKEDRPDYSKPLPRQKLNEKLQKTFENDRGRGGQRLRTMLQDAGEERCDRDTDGRRSV